MASLPDTWHYRVSAGPGWPGVSIIWLGEIASLICNFYLSVAACTIVWADPSLRYTSTFWDVKQPPTTLMFSKSSCTAAQRHLNTVTYRLKNYSHNLAYISNPHQYKENEPTVEGDHRTVTMKTFWIRKPTTDRCRSQAMVVQYTSKKHGVHSNIGKLEPKRKLYCINT